MALEACGHSIIGLSLLQMLKGLCCCGNAKSLVGWAVLVVWEPSWCCFLCIVQARQPLLLPMQLVPPVKGPAQY